MRVIAGRWRGRRLTAPSGEAVRPTTDRVKEALFNILGPSVTGAVVLDLCCGSGGLGIEALSRGAARAVFVDDHPRSLDSARSNLETCGAESTSYRLIRADAENWLGEWRPPDDGAGWILLADPPYRTGLAQAIMEKVDALAGEDGFVASVVEFGSRGANAGAVPGAAWDVRQYGESTLAVRRPNPGQECSGMKE